MESIEQAARRYVAAGLSVIPIEAGTKLPAIYQYGAVRWDRPSAPAREYTRRLPTDAELRTWFGGDSKHQVGIVCGGVSGGLCALDLEHTYVLELLQRTVPRVLAELPVVRTGRGFHVFLRSERELRHQRLAEVPYCKLFAELMAEDCYVVAPPSASPSSTDAGAIYHMVQGDLTQVPVLHADDIDALLAAARLPSFLGSTMEDLRFEIAVDGIHLMYSGQDGQVRAHVDWGMLSRLDAYLERYRPLLEAAAQAAALSAPQGSSCDDDGDYQDDDDGYWI